MFRRFGSAVNYRAARQSSLPAEDADVSAAVAEGFEADGITVITSTTCIHASVAAGHIGIGCVSGHHNDIVGTRLLVTTSRVPNSGRLGLEHLGVEPDLEGYLKVDDQLRSTGAADVWALGGLCGSIAHRIVPHAVFVD